MLQFKNWLQMSEKKNHFINNKNQAQKDAKKPAKMLQIPGKQLPKVGFVIEYAKQIAPQIHL